MNKNPLHHFYLTVGAITSIFISKLHIDSITPKHHHKNTCLTCSLLPSVVYQSLFLRILLKIKIKCYWFGAFDLGLLLIAFNTKGELMCADLLSLLFKIKFIKKMIPNVHFTYFTERP